MPIGFRQGHAAVRNAQLLLARERAILREMELQVVHDLSNAVGDVDRAYIVAQTNYNRRVAAAQQMAAVQAAFDADTASLLDLVESQRRQADADSRYARSMVEYTLAVKNVMFESNTLLENNGINLAEGPWPAKAYHDAKKRDELRSRPLRLSYILPQGPLVSQGIYPQRQSPPAVVTEGNGTTIPGARLAPRPERSCLSRKRCPPAKHCPRTVCRRRGAPYPAPPPRMVARRINQTATPPSFPTRGSSRCRPAAQGLPPVHYVPAAPVVRAAPQSVAPASVQFATPRLNAPFPPPPGVVRASEATHTLPLPRGVAPGTIAPVTLVEPVQVSAPRFAPDGVPPRPVVVAPDLGPGALGFKADAAMQSQPPIQLPPAPSLPPTSSEVPPVNR